MKEKVYAYLEDRAGGATSEEIAREALGLRGAKGPVAEKVVRAAIDEDQRFSLDAHGLWLLRSEVPIQRAPFVALGMREGVGEEALCWELSGRRVQMNGPETAFPGGGLGGSEPESVERLSAFVEFVDGAVPAAFRLSWIRRSVNRLSRRMLGRTVLEAGICLHRLGRRRFPDRVLPSLDALAEAMGLTFLARRNVEAEASLQAEVLLRLLDWCKDQGHTSVEAVMADLYPDATPVQFEAYSFDEAYLKDLPQAPGVYLMRDREGKVVYVGKAVNLRERVGHYFARRSERPEKTRKILDRIWSMEVETVGSELEALILEARLIRLCEPEFNTQIRVHEREANLGTWRNFVLVLPSADPERVESFCVREGFPVFQIRVRQDLSDWKGVSEQVSRLFFEHKTPPEQLKDDDRDALEILKSWLVPQWDRVNVVDMDGTGPAAEVLRVLSETIQGCEVEGWEKVWRV